MADEDGNAYTRVDDHLRGSMAHMEDLGDIVRRMDDGHLKDALERPLFRAYDELSAARKRLLKAIVEVQREAERYHRMREELEDAAESQ
jgi:hypothetical protein